MVKPKIIKEQKKGESIIREIELNNKSRKGTYIYVKQKKGERGSYYKKKEGLSINDYINTKVYGGVIRKRGGVTGKKTIKKYVDSLKKYKRIEDIIQPAYAEHSIKNAERMSLFQMKRAYIRLLTNKQAGMGKAPVNDSMLAEILSRNENVEKWKNRIEYKVELIGKEGKLAELTSAHRGKTLQNIKTDLKEANIKVGMNIADFSPTVKTNLEPKGYKYSHLNNGTLSEIRIKMIFRKSKV